MMTHKDNEPVVKFFEDVEQSVALGQVSYAPRAPRYMEIQFRIFATAMRKSVCKWIAPDSTILDVGCGHGELLRVLTQRYRIYGIDLNPGLLRKARISGLSVSQSNATAQPFAADQFDVIICAEVIQHFPHPQALFLEMARVCRPGGALILSTLNKRSLLRSIFSVFSERSRLGSFELPIIRRTAEEVCGEAQRCGWQPRDACWVLSPTLFVVYGAPPAPLRERLATNYILYFTKVA